MKVLIIIIIIIVLLIVTIGQWSNDVRHGYGKYTYANGDSYDGEWDNNIRQGHGTYTFNDTGLRMIITLMCFW